MSLQGILLFSFRAAALALPVTLFFCLGRFFLLRAKKQPFHLLREGLYAVFCFYLVALVQITVIRGGVSLWELPTLERSLETIQLVPVIHTLAELQNGLWAFVYPVVGNMVWFVPLGFLLPLIKPSWAKTLHICLAGCCLSLTIEVCQWIFGSGISDIDDVLFNTLGALAGYLLYLLGRRLFPKLP